MRAAGKEPPKVSGEPNDVKASRIPFMQRFSIAYCSAMESIHPKSAGDEKSSGQTDLSSLPTGESSSFSAGRQLIRRLRGASAGTFRTYLAEKQYLRPRATLREVLTEAQVKLEFCPAVAEQSLDVLGVDPETAVGRLKGTELDRLARYLHRFLRQAQARALTAGRRNAARTTRERCAIPKSKPDAKPSSSSSRRRRMEQKPLLVHSNISRRT
jgi:hypothetical protein